MYRYMAYFQWPVLPELDLLSESAIPSLFRDANPGMLSADDVEAYKFTLATYSAFQIRSSLLTCNCEITGAMQ